MKLTRQAVALAPTSNSSSVSFHGSRGKVSLSLSRIHETAVSCGHKSPERPGWRLESSPWKALNLFSYVVGATIKLTTSQELKAVHLECTLKFVSDAAVSMVEATWTKSNHGISFHILAVHQTSAINEYCAWLFFVKAQINCSAQFLDKGGHSRDVIARESRSEHF